MRLPYAGRGAARFFENCNDRKWWKRKPRIDPAEQWGQEVQHSDLAKSECPSAQHAGIEPPPNYARPVEFQNFLHLKSCLRRDAHQLLFRVATKMPEDFVQTTV